MTKTVPQEVNLVDLFFQLNNRLSQMETRVRFLEAENMQLSRKFGLTFERNVNKKLEEMETLVKEKNFAPVFPLCIEIYEEELEMGHQYSSEQTQRLDELFNAVLEDSSEEVAEGRIKVTHYLVGKALQLNGPGIFFNRAHFWSVDKKPFEGPQETWREQALKYLNSVNSG